MVIRKQKGQQRSPESSQPRVKEDIDAGGELDPTFLEQKPPGPEGGAAGCLL